MSRAGHRVTGVVAGLVVVVAMTGCRSRPDVRVLADERLRVPVQQIVALYEERARQRVHVAYSSRGRMDVMLVSGKDDLILADAAQIDARPATGGLDRTTRRDFAARGGGERYAVILRERAAARAAVQAFWRFATDAEAGAILASAGFSAP